MFPAPLPQVPNPVWHPAPQCSVVLPQNPLLEQQSPNPDPLQIFPLAVPQLPSVVTLAAAEHSPNAAWHPAPQCAASAPQNPLAEQQSPNTDPLHVLPPAAPPPHAPSVDTFPVAAHPLPKSGWQPAPQCAAVVPQKPAAEQQVPKVVPVQLNWDVPPQLPSGEGSPGPGGGAVGALQLP
jgi:hypothetical protein